MSKTKNTDKDPFLQLLTTTISDLIELKNVSVDAVCEALCISRTHLHRKVKALSGLSTTLFIRQVKMIRAQQYLQNTEWNISQIAYEVGVLSPQNLSKYFQEAFDISPTEYRRLFQSKKGTQKTDVSSFEEGHTDDKVAKKSIVILPFENLTSAPDNAHFSDGITEEIMYGLSKVKDLHVVGRASSFYFKNSEESFEEIGKKLNVEHILTGNVRRRGDNVRIMVRLLTAEDGFQVWADRYDRHLEDIFEIQEEIAAHVVENLKITLIGTDNHGQFIKRKTDSIKAYELYLKGREQFELRNDLDLSLKYFYQATLIDESFVHAYFGMAYAMLYKCIFAGQRPKDAIGDIKAAYQKAIALDPSGAEGHIINGWIKFYFDFDFEGALRALNLAIAADPIAMDAYRIKAYFYAFHGFYAEAIPLAEKAYQLDPLGYNAWFSLADIWRRASQYDKAIELFLPLLPKFPDNALLNEILALSYYYKGDLVAAQSTFSNQQELPTQISIWTVGRYIYHFYHGERALLRTFLIHLENLKTKKWIQPTILALVHFHLGEEEAAIPYLNQAYEERDFGLKHIISEPHWDPFRTHPAVVALLDKVL